MADRVLRGELGQRRDLLIDPVTRFVLGRLDLVLHLQAQPEVDGVAEVTCQPHRRVGGDGAFAPDDLADSHGRDAKVFGEPILTDSHGVEELLAQDFARVNRRHDVIGSWHIKYSVAVGQW